MMRSGILKPNQLCPLRTQLSKMSTQLGDLGSGAGQGGGGGGSIRAAGGAFGRLEAAHEEQFFHKKQAQQLQQLRDMKAMAAGEAAAKDKSATDKKTLK